MHNPCVAGEGKPLCQGCPLYGRPQVHPTGDGPITVVGMAPGPAEAQKGRPFVGPSGDVLFKALASAGVPRGAVRLDNAVLCALAPGETPPKEALRRCRPHIRMGRATVALGNDALWSLTGTDGVGTHDGQVLHTPGGAVIPTYHPATVLHGNTMSFHSLVSALRLAYAVAHNSAPPPQPSVRIITPDTLPALCATLPPTVFLDVETDILDFKAGRILCVSLSDGHTAWVVPWDGEYLSLYGNPYPNVLDDPRWRDALRSALARRQVICHNALYDLPLLLREGFSLSLADDTLTMAYCINENPVGHGLKECAQRWLGVPNWESALALYTDGSKPYTQVPPTILFHYSALDAYYTARLYPVLLSAMGQSEYALYRGRGAWPGLLAVERALLDTAYSKGCLIDWERAKSVYALYQASLREMARELGRDVGFPLNPNSHKDVARALYSVHKLAPVSATNRAGKPLPEGSTAREALERYAHHPWVAKLLEYRSYQKVVGTYLENLVCYDGRVYPDLRPWGTVTGRLVASRTNPLVIPRGTRGDLYRALRQVFVADPGHILVQMDYSGFELRVCAVLSQDPYMLSVLSDPARDWHSETAERMFGDRFRTAQPQVRKELRTTAKGVVFGVLYGMHPTTLARILHCPQSTAWHKRMGTQGEGCPLCDKGSVCPKAIETATEVAQAILAPLTTFAQWRNDVVRRLRLHGFVENPFGRRRRFGYLTPQTTPHAILQAVNFMVQSTASDICLTAFVRLTQMGNGVTPLWPIHDSVLLQVPHTYPIQPLITTFSTTPQDLLHTTLPFPAEVSIGPTWGDMEPYEQH